jgi:hypothetical protein
MPALSFAVFLVACVVVIAVQSNTLSGLKQQNEELRAAGQNLEQLRTDNADYKRLLAESQELDRLRHDKSELERLRGEVAALRAQATDTDKLSTENQALQARVAAAALANSTNDYFGQEAARYERMQCTDNLKRIGLAFRTWSVNHNDTLPQDFISMTNELNDWLLLRCPGDKSRNLVGWADVAQGNVSYQWLAPGAVIDKDSFHVVAVICPIHNNVGLIDGSVQQMSPEGMQKYIKTVNGHLMMVR